jgi:carbamoyltransferase
LQSPYVDRIYIQPSADDAGCALGAAFEMAKTNGFQIQKMDHPYFGPEFSAEEIETELKSLKLKYEERDDIEAYMAEKVAKGNVVGWFQGRMELGPRALGNRSIIADPRDPKMKEKVNMLIKFREPFRPFAPSVLFERADEYFENVCESPFMNIVFNVKKPQEIPAVTHEDNTSRIHTVRQDVNPKYHKLIKSFSDITSVPVVMNTSFNVKGQPIVCTPQQAISTFFGTGMSTLAIGNFLVEKKDQ